MTTTLDVNGLAALIRQVDGDHSLGAGALAEALIESVTEMVADGWDQGWIARSERDRPMRTDGTITSSLAPHPSLNPYRTSAVTA